MKIKEKETEQSIIIPPFIDWGEGPWALAAPVKAIKVGVGL